MSTAIVAWLLFLSVQQESPIGAFTELVECQRVSKEIVEAVRVRATCNPATKAVLDFYSGKCLGDVQLTEGCDNTNWKI